MSVIDTGHMELIMAHISLWISIVLPEPSLEQWLSKASREQIDRVDYHLFSTPSRCTGVYSKRGYSFLFGVDPMLTIETKYFGRLPPVQVYPLSLGEHAMQT